MRISQDMILAFKRATKIAIYTHINTDGDAIGSSCALKIALEKLGKNVDIFCDSRIPRNLLFLKGVENINVPKFKDYDLAVSLDANDSSRLGKYEKEFLKKRNSIQIDHHVNNPNFGKYNFVVESASSVGFLVSKVIEELGVEFDDEIARCLLTAVLSDTGGLRFENTDKETVTMVAQLVKRTNIQFFDIMGRIFESEEMGFHEIYKIAMNNTRFFADNKIAMISLRKKDYDRAKINFDDVKNLSRIGTELADVKITIVISESEENVFHVSFRSRGGYDVRQCATVFGGGGHKVSAGCKIFGNFESAYERLLKSAMDIL